MNRTFMFTSHFVREWTRLGFTDDDQIRLEQTIINNPQIGNVIVGAGGFRKMRFAFEGRGKSGSTRIIYLDIAKNQNTVFIDIYKKNQQDTFTQEQIASYAQFARILKGE